MSSLHPLPTAQKPHPHWHLLVLLFPAPTQIWRNLERDGFSRFSEWQKSFFCLEILVPASLLRFQPVLPQNPQGSMILSVELSGYLCYYSLPHMNSQKLPWKIWLLRDCGIQQLCMWQALHIPCRDEAAICEKFFYLECHWAAGTRNS